ncbi:MAG TPA: glucosaminidase domain-containing protein [Symbiobacteriaceae bacterium]|nr:glucosaminidase domain-containing protein [Symbiobacteriaceae bacterium]
MTRIVVRPESLERLSAQMQQVASEMEILDARLDSMLRALDWNVREKMGVEQRASEGHRQSGQLRTQAGSLSQFLAQKAKAFADADGAGLRVIGSAPAAPPAQPSAPGGSGGGTQATVLPGGPIDPELFQAATPAQRFDMVKPALLELEKTTGVPWQIQAAQWALESGWGVQRPHDIATGRDSLNMFGIKGTGPAGSVTAKTWEEINGQKVQQNAQFRAYNTLEESLEDHALLLTKPHYEKAMACGGDLECWAKKLGPEGCNYATDSAYPQKLMALIRKNGW